MVRQFKFEAEIYESLNCLPTAARRKLDGALNVTDRGEVVRYIEAAGLDGSSILNRCLTGF